MPTISEEVHRIKEERKRPERERQRAERKKVWKNIKQVENAILPTLTTPAARDWIVRQFADKRENDWKWVVLATLYSNEDMLVVHKEKLRIAIHKPMYYSDLIACLLEKLRALYRGEVVIQFRRTVNEDVPTGEFRVFLP